MKITDNFTKEEFEKSSTAKQLKIDNAVPDEFMDNLYSLAEQLQIIRDTWKAPIIITSGYRSPEVSQIIMLIFLLTSALLSFLGWTTTILK